MLEVYNLQHCVVRTVGINLQLRYKLLLNPSSTSSSLCSPSNSYSESTATPYCRSSCSSSHYLQKLSENANLQKLSYTSHHKHWTIWKSWFFDQLESSRPPDNMSTSHSLTILCCYMRVSFAVIRIAFPNSSVVETPHNNTLTCNVVNGAQMLIVGGIFLPTQKYDVWCSSRSWDALS